MDLALNIYAIKQQTNHKINMWKSIINGLVMTS